MTKREGITESFKIRDSHVLPRTRLSVSPLVRKKNLDHIIHIGQYAYCLMNHQRTHQTSLLASLDPLDVPLDPLGAPLDP